MAITRKPPGPPKPAAPVKEMTDEAFERVASGALDAGSGGGGRPAAGPRQLGKGYAMGHKRQITHMITSELLEKVDAEALKNGEARATVINRAIRQLLG